MDGCAICSRLRGRHAGEGGEAAARSFEEFMESTFPRGLDSTGPLVSPHSSFAAPPCAKGLVRSTLQLFSVVYGLHRSLSVEHIVHHWQSQLAGPIGCSA